MYTVQLRNSTQEMSQKDIGMQESEIRKRKCRSRVRVRRGSTATNSPVTERENSGPEFINAPAAFIVLETANVALWRQPYGALEAWNQSNDRERVRRTDEVTILAFAALRMSIKPRPPPVRRCAPRSRASRSGHPPHGCQ
jgi:hypothetical protein